MADTRERMINAAVVALQRHGVSGMSFTQILADSGAARGAIYHHFPGGKYQLVAEAAERNGQDVCAHLGSLPADTPVGVVEAFLSAIRPVLAASAAGTSCAVAAIAMSADHAESDGDHPLRQIAADAFDSWAGALTDRLVEVGLPPQDAMDLAITLVTLLQGAHVQCRAAGRLEPFERAARVVQALVRSHYPDR
ncbi:MAG TPA: TetR/AcrR family transcriptional regulator [Kineosporiaceae bacterium]|nr:TetR/AcrR family transcriptional regulator [Kineosporiaceae bacterium]